MCNFPVGMRCIDRSTSNVGARHLVGGALAAERRQRHIGGDEGTLLSEVRPHALAVAVIDSFAGGAPAPHIHRNLPTSPHLR